MSIIARGTLFATAFAAIFAIPGAADACAVCYQAKTDASRIAFIGTTALLTFLPLVVVGGGVWWVRRKFAQAAAGPEVDAAPQTPICIKSLKLSA